MAGVPVISALCMPSPPTRRRAVSAGLFLEADVGQWAAVCAVNYLGVVHTLKAGVPAMAARRAGRVLVINSTGGFMGAPLVTRAEPVLLVQPDTSISLALKGEEPFAPLALASALQLQLCALESVFMPTRAVAMVGANKRCSLRLGTASSQPSSNTVPPIQ